MKKIAFIINGKTKSHRRVIKKIGKQFSKGYILKFFITQPDKNGSQLAINALKLDFTHLICVGGDGTLNEVANGIMESRKFFSESKFNAIRIGVLPYGTGNDFAKSINSSFDLPILKNRIDTDQFKQLDLGLAKFKDLSGNDAARYFINITDVGLGGLVVKRVNSSTKLFGSFIAYQWAIIRSLVTYRHQTIKSSADTTIYTGKILNYIIANGAYFGSGLAIAPDAKPDDGIFSLVIVGRVSLFFYLKSLRAIKNGLHIQHPEVFYQQAKEINIESNVPHPIDMDGEYVGNTPLKIKMIEKAVKFLC